MKFYQLKTNNFQFSKLKKDFYFIVNYEIFPTNKIVADFISPKIGKIHETDKTLSSFEIETQNNCDFNKFLKYFEEKEVELTDDEITYFVDILKQLENFIEIENFVPILNEEMQENNVIPRIILKNELSINYEEEIIFISKNLEKLYKEKREEIISLKSNIIDDILQCRSLQIDNEDFLFKFVVEIG